jgi:uncharacterized protein (TIGR04255 family)
MISLTKEFVAISDKDYQNWERLRQDIELAVRALGDVYSPAFYTRVGLRYKNVIDREDLGIPARAWRTLLSRALTGGILDSEELADSVRQTQTTALLVFDGVPGGSVTLRHGLASDPSGGDHQTYLIDADVHTEDRGATENVMGTLDQFHQVAGNLFRWAISQELHAALRPVESA